MKIAAEATRRGEGVTEQVAMVHDSPQDIGQALMIAIGVGGVVAVWADVHDMDRGVYVARFMREDEDPG